MSITIVNDIHGQIQKILSVGVGPDTVFSTYFTEGHTNLPRESIWPLEGVHTSISKETYSNLLISLGVQAPCPPSLDPLMNKPSPCLNHRSLTVWQIIIFSYLWPSKHYFWISLSYSVYIFGCVRSYISCFIYSKLEKLFQKLTCLLCYITFPL